MKRVIDPEDWGRAPDVWRGEVEGGPFGSGVSLIFNSTRVVGAGPRLHRHPYSETFIVRSGRVLFTLGEETIEARAGQIVVAPAGAPHKFRNLGPDPLEMIDVHASGAFETEWLE